MPCRDAAPRVVAGNGFESARRHVHGDRPARAVEEGRDAEAQVPQDRERYWAIDLHPTLVAVLRERRKSAFAAGLYRDDSFVFCTEDGRPLSHRNTARDIEAAAKKAGLNGEGLRPVSAHLLRHTFASRLIALGLDVVEVARQLGDKPDTLLRIYAQVFNDARRRDEVRQRITEGTKIAL